MKIVIAPAESKGYNPVGMEFSSEPRVLFSRFEIAAMVDRLAAEISRDYKDKNPLVIGILKGSFIFMADLVRRLDFLLEVDFVQLSSYGRDRSTAGKLKLVQDITSEIRGRCVLVIEDVVDTGHSLSFLLTHLAELKPASLKLCVMVDKPSRRETPVTIDYLGFKVPDKFIVGYGMDYDEKYRNLPDIGYIDIGR